jgi:ATP-dependent Clp protease adaptor protein ClpS
MMATETIEKPRVGGPGTGSGGAWRVIVLNDSHNTFDHVARTLARVIPNVSVEQGYRFADKIHNAGQAIVWTGEREPAELYWEQLRDAGLTMAPLEEG